MGFPKILFRVVENKSCPLFEYGDEFGVTGIAVSMNSKEDNTFLNTAVVDNPTGKENCKILTGDLTKIIIQYERADKIPVCLISCSGCTGSIRLEHNKEQLLDSSDNHHYSNEIGYLMQLFIDFGFFLYFFYQILVNVIGLFILNTFF